uniref:Uncharacterized protein n=1 Tax=Callithrix jacchus TaxID=9483 RepID=A0A8I3X5C1_CALJA
MATQHWLGTRAKLDDHTTELQSGRQRDAVFKQTSKKHFGRLRQVDHLRSGVRDQPGQHGETPSLLKNTKISQVWQAPIIPATPEAEARELLEPGKRRLQSLKIAPLHSALGDKSETPSQKKKKKTTWQNEYCVLQSSHSARQLSCFQRCQDSSPRCSLQHPCFATAVFCLCVQAESPLGKKTNMCPTLNSLPRVTTLRAPLGLTPT